MRRNSTGRGALVLAAGLFCSASWSSGAIAQISLAPAPSNINGNQVCTSAAHNLQVSDTEDGCTAGAQDVTSITFESGSDLLTISGSTARFYGTADFHNTVQMSGSQAFSGTTGFNSTVSFTGPSVTFDTGATFQDQVTFNQSTDFNYAISTTSISNSGTIGTSYLVADAVSSGNITGTNIKAASSFIASSGADVNMGGNQVHGVAAGTAANDAVNVGQLNSVTGNVTTLQTTVATQGTQISGLQTGLAATNSTVATHTTQIGALQAAESLMEDQVATLFDLRGRDRRDMKQGIATAIAMSNAPMPSAPGKVSYAVNGARFRGEYAIGGSLMYRLPGDTPVAINAGFSYAGNKNNGLRLGVAGEF